MSETSSIVKVLKRALKAEGVTYTQVAEAIETLYADDHVPVNPVAE